MTGWTTIDIEAELPRLRAYARALTRDPVAADDPADRGQSAVGEPNRDQPPDPGQAASEQPDGDRPANGDRLAQFAGRSDRESGGGPDRGTSGVSVDRDQLTPADRRRP